MRGRRRGLTALLGLAFLIYMFTGSKRVSIFSAAPKFPRDIILSHSPISDQIEARFVLFTASTKFDPRENVVDGSKHEISDEIVRGKRTVIYNGIPAYYATASRDTVAEDQVVVAIATTSTRVLHEDFMPKRYLANTKTMLLLVMPESDQIATAKVQRHLSGPEYNLRCLILRVPAEDEQDRKFNVLGSLMEFAAYKEGQADYYTIIDDDVFIPSYPAFLSAISTVNPAESHMLADESITSAKRSSTPIIVTKGLLTRAAAGTKWDECVRAVANLPYADKKLSKCVQLVQNSQAQSARIDFVRDLLLEETISEPIVQLESGLTPITLRALFNFGGLPVDEESFSDILFGRLKGFSAESALTRVSLDKDKYKYTHGFSIVQEAEERYFISKAIPFTEPLSKDNSLAWLSMLYRTSKGKQIQVDWVLNGNDLDTSRGK